MYEEEYVLDTLVHAANGYFSFRYTEFFLPKKYTRRRRALILWSALYILVQTFYGNIIAPYPLYDRFFHVLLQFALLLALQTLFFAKDAPRQAFALVSFGVGWEILRFVVSPLAYVLLDVWSHIWEWLINSVINYALIAPDLLQEYMSATNRIALIVVLTGCRAIQLAVFYIYLRLIGKNMPDADYELGKRESYFLLLPCAAVFCIDLTLRLMAYSVDNSALMLIYDRVPETLVLLPAGSLLLLGFVVSSVILLRGLAEGKDEERKRLFLENQVTEIQTQIKELDSIYSDIRGLKHDLRAHVAGIAAYLRNRFGADENTGDLSSYLRGMENTVAELDFTDHTGNSLTDVILHRFRQQARQKNIDVTFAFRYPPGNNFGVYDVSIILNNALENAVEACGKVAENPYISLRSYEKGNLFIVAFFNFYFFDCE